MPALIASEDVDREPCRLQSRSTSQLRREISAWSAIEVDPVAL